MLSFYDQFVREEGMDLATRLQTASAHRRRGAILQRLGRDEEAETVKRRASTTVQWSVERLKRDYFKRDPSQIIDIWLFQDTASYEENVERLFGEKPSTPYGYYSPRRRALSRNIHRLMTEVPEL